MSEKFKSLSLKEKIQYIWDFYKLRITVVIIVIALLSSWIIRVTNRIDPDVYCIVFNDVNNNNLKQHITKTYSDYIGNDRHPASVDISYIFYYDENEKMNWPNEGASVKYMSLQTTGKADTLITDYDSMLWAIKENFIYPVEDVLPKDLYEQLKPYFISMKIEDASDEEQSKIIYGLDISETKIYKGHSDKYKQAFLCFPTVSKNPEAAIKFVKYIYGIK